MVALFFVLLGIYLNFTSIEIIALSLVITLVLAAEMINTALELTIDMIKTEVDPVVRVIKDISAGAVLLAALNAVISGYVLFSPKLPFHLDEEMARIRQTPWTASFMAIILVLGLSVIGKIIFHKGTPLRGGMPSGHAAVAFSIWTIIAFLTNNSIVIGLSFIMAFLIARHRIKDAIHTLWEVVAGAILGVLVTILIFQIFR
jgi:diacylglycerol kinase (ATP)